MAEQEAVVGSGVGEAIYRLSVEAVAAAAE